MKRASTASSRLLARSCLVLNAGSDRPRVSVLVVLFVIALVFPSLLEAEDLGQVKRAVVKITTQVEGKTKVGTGIIVKLAENAAYILTAAHVVEGDQHPKLMFFSDPHRPFPARVLALEGGDPRGLAALLVEGSLPSDVHTLELDQATSLSGGEAVTLIGFPLAEGTLWTVTTGTISGRKGSVLSFSGIADEGNSGGPVLFQGKVIGIVTEVRGKFNYAAPAVTARFALEGWGIRLPGQIAEEEETGRDVKLPKPEAQPLKRMDVTGTYGGVTLSLMGLVGLQAQYKQNGNSVSGSYVNTQGDFGAVQGHIRENVFEGRADSQLIPGMFCEFTGQSADGGKTIEGSLKCSSGDAGSFALERQ